MKAGGGRLLAALALLELSARGAQAACLPNAIPEADRANIPHPRGGEVPFGLWLHNWDSAKLASLIVKFLAEEVLGINSTVSGTGSSSTSGLYATAGCLQPNKFSSDPECGPNSTFIHHMALEVWGVAKIKTLNDRLAPWPEIIPEDAGEMGYTGIDGIYVFDQPKEAAYRAEGLPLEYYRSYDVNWTRPWRYFDNYTVYDLAELRPCTNTRLMDKLNLKTYLEVTGDRGGVVENSDGSVIGRCWFGSWWFSPACRNNPETCIPMITGSSGWYMHDMMQKAAVYSMPFAIAVGRTSAMWRALTLAHGGVPYWWQPDSSFIERLPKKIAFPPYDAAAYGKGIRLTMGTETRLSKWMHSRLALQASRLYTFGLRISFTMETMNEMLLQKKQQNEEAEKVACDWIKANEASWRPWIPIKTECIPGKGLVNASGSFVMLRANASACAWCGPGRHSVEYRDVEGGTYRCEPCQVGRSQPNPGQLECEICKPGSYAEVGKRECSACPIGTYTSQPEMDSCDTCKDVLPGSTTQYPAASAPTFCHCPNGAALSRASPAANPECKVCGEGLSCLGGVRQGAAGQTFAGTLKSGQQHQPPMQDAGFSSGPIPWEGGPPDFLVRCSNKLRCPANMELGTCPNGMESRACAQCSEGHFPNGNVCTSCDEEGGLEFLILGVVVLIAAIIGVTWIGTKKIGLFCSPVVSVAATFTTSLAALQVLAAIGTFGVDWPEPMKSLKAVLSLLILDVDRQRPQCIVGQDTPLLSYLGSLAVYPIFGVLLSTLLFIARLRDPKITMNTAINAHGTAISSIFTSIAVVCVLPLSCGSNPDGTSTVSSHKSVVCWDSGEHTGMMIAAAFNTLFFVVGYFSLITWATLEYTTKMASPGATVHMTRFRFLFGPYVPDKYYFGLIFNTRKLVIGMLPSIGVDTPQVQLLLMIMVISVNCTLQAALWPWRTLLANLFDITCSTVLMLVVTVGFMLGDFDYDQGRQIAQTLLFISLLLMVIVAVGVVIYCIANLFFHRRQYQFFLSHHKVGAGLLCRWVKIILAGKGYDRVFLDSDDLLQLDKLINIVAYDCDNIVVFLTRETLCRPWCAMEVVAASKAGTRLVPVSCDDDAGVSDDFLDRLDTLWTPEQMATMASGGVRTEDVVKAYKSFRDLPKIYLSRANADPELHSNMIEEVLARCKGKELPAPGLQRQPSKLAKMTSWLSAQISSKATASNSTRPSAHSQIAILGDMGQFEPACACRIIQFLLQEKMQQHIKILTPESQAQNRVTPTYALIVLRPGITKDLWFAEELVQVAQSPALVEMAPLLISDFFDFPNSQFWDDLGRYEIFTKKELDMKNIDVNEVEVAYRKLFNTLAMRFTGHGSTLIQRSEILSMKNRISGAIANTGNAGGLDVTRIMTNASPKSKSSNDLQSSKFRGDVDQLQASKANNVKEAMAAALSAPRSKVFIEPTEYSEKI